MTVEIYVASSGFNPEQRHNPLGSRDQFAFMQAMNAGLPTSLQRSRGQGLRNLFDPRREIDDECGFPDNSALTLGLYQKMYDREAVATRVVEVYPDESWQVQPTVFETEDIEEETDFEREWKALGQSLGSPDDEVSHFQGEQGNPIWEYIHRADKQSGIGHFGAIFLGLNDGLDPREPAVPKKDQKITQLRVFGESQIQISKFEEDKKSKRIGRPVSYTFTLADPNDGSQDSPQSNTSDLVVHHSRVIHLADNLGSSEIFAVPRQRPVWNNLYNLRKLYGGSAEMYWMGAFAGISFETHPSLGTDAKVDTTAIKEQMVEYSDGLRRFLTSVGLHAHSLAPQVVDPSAQIEVQLDAICIKIACPKRIFMGSERGELASSQDQKAWNARLKHRQQMYLTPRVIVPFVNRLIALGVLPKPKEGFSVSWPELESVEGLERAEIFSKKMDGLATYVQGGVSNIISPMDILIRDDFLGMDTEEAEEILEGALEADPLIPEEQTESKIIPEEKPEEQEND